MMTVAELISALRTMPQEAQVFLEDPTAQPGPGVCRLVPDEVRCIELGWWESNGMCINEPWRSDGTLNGPFSAVLLGKLEYDAPLTPQEAAIAGGMYELSDEEMMRRIRKLRCGE